MLTDLRLIKDIPLPIANRDVSMNLPHQLHEPPSSVVHVLDKVPSLLPVDNIPRQHLSECQNPTAFSNNTQPGSLAGSGELLGYPSRMPTTQRYSPPAMAQTTAAEPFCYPSCNYAEMGGLSRPSLEFRAERSRQQESICTTGAASSSYHPLLPNRDSRPLGYCVEKSSYSVNQSFSMQSMQDLFPRGNQALNLIRRTRETRTTEVIEILGDEVEHPGLVGSGTLLQ